MNIEREPNMTRTALLALAALMVLTGNAGRPTSKVTAAEVATVTAR
jgi:hypothetical protein